MNNVLLLDNHDSFTYNLVEIIRATPQCDCTVMAHDNIHSLEIGLYDKIIFSPGPGLPQEFPEMWDLLRRYAGQIPILGICLGMQAMAEYYGGSLFNLPVPQHGQRREISVIDRDEALYRGLPSTLHVGLYHSWTVSPELPDSLVATSVTADGLIMSLRHRELDVRGVQFHPESYMTEQGTVILRNWLSAA